MKFNQYLVEHRSVKIKKEGFILELNSGRYSDILKYYSKKKRHDDGIIYRGMGTNIFNGEYGVVDPSQSIRKSASTRNYYMLIMTQDPSWNGYPDRSKSIICATSYKKAYKHGDVFVVLPQNGSSIGIASAPDIWGSFKGLDAKRHEDGPLADFFMTIPKALEYVNDNRSGIFMRLMDLIGMVDHSLVHYDKSLGELKTACRTIDEFTKEYPDLLMGWGFDDVFKQHYKGDLYQCMVSVIDPKRSGITTSVVGKNLPTESREVWTEGRSLLVRSDIFWELYEKGEIK